MRITRLSLLTGLGAALLAQPAFDYLAVQRDILMGINDPAALNRGMETVEKVLKDDPDHAPALVYHGIGLLLQSQGHPDYFPKAIEEMDRAVKLDPDNLGVRMPRASALISMSRQLPDSPFKQEQIEKARTDFQYAFEEQKDRLDQLGTHPLGELLQNLGDIYSRQDKPDQAQKYYDLLRSKLPNTEYAKRAGQWLETRKTLPVSQTTCVGCHTGNKL